MRGWAWFDEVIFMNLDVQCSRCMPLAVVRALLLTSHACNGDMHVQ